MPWFLTGYVAVLTIEQTEGIQMKKKASKESNNKNTPSISFRVKEHRAHRMLKRARLRIAPKGRKGFAAEIPQPNKRRAYGGENPIDFTTERPPEK